MDIDDLSKRLGTSTTEAAIRAAVQLTERLLYYNDRGYQIAIVENGHHIHAPDEPTRSWTPIERWIQDTLHSKPR